jgi:hypothetical protein
MMFDGVRSGQESIRAGWQNELYANSSGICVKDFQQGTDCSANDHNPVAGSRWVWHLKARRQSSDLEAAAVFVPSS